MAIKKKKRRDTTIVDVMEQTGFVYVISFGRIYKIGQTWNIKQRLKQLQEMNPFCRVLKLIELTGYTVAEKRLHEFFATKRIAGEWFELKEGDLDKIIPYLRKPGLKHRIISIVEHGETAYVHSKEERITVLEGLNKALLQENRHLKHLYHQALNKNNYERYRNSTKPTDD